MEEVAPTNQSMTMELVRQHGEILARLAYIVDEDHKDLGELKKSVEVIAKAVENQETAKSTRDGIKAKLLNYVLPFAYAAAGGLVGHFIK